MKSNPTSWNSGDGFMISAPADNRKEALKITNELSFFGPEVIFK